MDLHEFLTLPLPTISTETKSNQVLVGGDIFCFQLTGWTTSNTHQDSFIGCFARTNQIRSTCRHSSASFDFVLICLHAFLFSLAQCDREENLIVKHFKLLFLQSFHFWRLVFPPSQWQTQVKISKYSLNIKVLNTPINFPMELHHGLEHFVFPWICLLWFYKNRSLISLQISGGGKIELNHAIFSVGGLIS